MRNTDFQKSRLLAAIGAHVFFVDREIMHPLVDQAAIVPLEVPDEATLPDPTHARQGTAQASTKRAASAGINVIVQTVGALPTGFEPVPPP